MPPNFKKTDEETSSVSEESPSLELLTPGNTPGIIISKKKNSFKNEEDYSLVQIKDDRMNLT